MLGWLMRWRERQAKRALRQVLARIDEDHERVRSHMVPRKPGDDIIAARLDGPPAKLVVNVTLPMDRTAMTKAVMDAMRADQP